MIDIGEGTDDSYDNLAVRGNLPFNAETTIDWHRRIVKFSYPQQLDFSDEKLMARKRNLAYFCHRAVDLIASALTLIWGLWLFILPSSPWYVPKVFAIFTLAAIERLPYMAYIPVAICIYFLVMASAMLLAAIADCGFYYVFGWLSVWLHNHSQKLRDTFPTTNTFLNKIFLTKRTINLNEKMGKHWTLIDDTLVFDKMSVVLTELEFSDNLSEHIEQIYTKCYSPNPSILSSKFKLFIKFDEPINRGCITIWS